MSVDLIVIPTVSEFLYWNTIKTRFLSLITPQEKESIGDISLIRSKAGLKEIIEDNHQLSLVGSYSLQLKLPCTLGISLFSNEDNNMLLEDYDMALEFLEDYGRNLEAETIKTLAASWKKLNYYYEITSSGGRSLMECSLFVALTSAIAYECCGYVMVMGDELDLKVGVYKPEQFKLAKWTKFWRG